MKRIALTFAVSTATLTTPVFADGHLMVVEEPLTLDVHLHDGRFSYSNDWPVELEAQRLTGVTLNNMTVGSDTNSREAFELMIAGSYLPDVIGGQLIKDNVNRFGPEGAFLALDELIEAHAPNILAQMQARPEIFDSARARDGELYFVPYLTDGKYGRAYFIREDWLDAVGLETPETLDELYTVLTAFRDGDPNGNMDMQVMAIVKVFQTSRSGTKKV